MDEDSSQQHGEQRAGEEGDVEEGDAEEGDVARTTEQGDELTEEHSLSQRQNRTKKPYARPRQPAQDPPSG